MITAPDLLATRDPRVPTDVVAGFAFLHLHTKPHVPSHLPGMDICLPSSLLKRDSELFQRVTCLKAFSSQHSVILCIIVLGSLKFDILDLLRTSMLFDCFFPFLFVFYVDKAY